MSTLDIKKNLKKYIIFTLFTLLFGIIYEQFSFGVTSYYMLFGFCIPLILGIIPSTVFLELNIKKPDQFTFSIYNKAVITLTIGSLLKGALDIYGTTNKLIIIYPIVGIILLITSNLMYFTKIKN